MVYLCLLALVTLLLMHRMTSTYKMVSIIKSESEEELETPPNFMSTRDWQQNSETQVLEPPTAPTQPTATQPKTKHKLTTPETQNCSFATCCTYKEILPGGEVRKVAVPCNVPTLVCHTTTVGNQNNTSCKNVTVTPPLDVDLTEGIRILLLIKLTRVQTETKAQLRERLKRLEPNSTVIVIIEVYV
jgi:hypothetical protein